MSACAVHRYPPAADYFIADGHGGWVSIWICRVCAHRLERPAQPGETAGT